MSKKLFEVEVSASFVLWAENEDAAELWVQKFLDQYDIGCYGMVSDVAREGDIAMNPEDAP